MTLNLGMQMDFLIYIKPQTLSDGSKVYDVRIGDCVFNAETKDAAEQLATAICGAINDLTVNTADIVRR